MRSAFTICLLSGFPFRVMISGFILSPSPVYLFVLCRFRIQPLPFLGVIAEFGEGQGRTAIVLRLERKASVALRTAMIKGVRGVGDFLEQIEDHGNCGLTM